MKTYYLIFIALLSPLFLSAQGTLPADPENPFLNLTLNMEVAFPVGPYRDRVNNGALMGKGIGIFYRMKSAPIDLGLRWDGFSYDHIRRPFNGNVQKTKSKIWILAPAIRLEPQTQLPFQPYIEGSLGFHRFFTKTYSYNVGDRIISFLSKNNESSRFDTYRLESDWGRAMGGAIGAYFILEKDYFTALDLQLCFRLSSVGNFLVQSHFGTALEDPIDNYDPARGAMTVVSVKMGVSVFGY